MGTNKKGPSRQTLVDRYFEDIKEIWWDAERINQLLKELSLLRDWVFAGTLKQELSIAKLKELKIKAYAEEIKNHIEDIINRITAHQK